MSKKRGLSLDEKRKRMMEIFFEKKEFFHLKELEKIAPKQKGITPMSVKDVLKGLVDDDMVVCEKVGTSSYYWAFPSTAINSRNNRMNTLQEKLAEYEKKLASVEKNIKAAQAVRVDNDHRRQVLQELKQLTEEHEKAAIELESLKDNDPELLEKIASEIEESKEAANKWTDNLFQLKSWIKKKFPIDEKQIDKQFGIPEDLDYVE